jgi:RimJ/RimL family protein N-acetyltransferase
VFTDRALLRLHVEAVWVISIPPLNTYNVDIPPEDAQPPWALYAGQIAQERVHIWSAGIDNTTRRTLLTLAETAYTKSPLDILPPETEREVALRLSAQPRISLVEAQQIARPLTEQDHVLIEAFKSGSTTYLFDAQYAPLFGVINNGQLLSLAHSSRRTAQACELGIDTRPEARRKGYALATTLLWADAVQQEGLIAFYSALAENTASIQLAHAAGYRIFAHGVTVSIQKQTS